MKKILFILLLLASVFAFTGCDILFAESTTVSAAQQTKADQKEIQEKAISSLPIPKVEHFMERRTITEWTKRWDVPNKPCYVYVFVGDRCLGYFVSIGKPASTRSYLVPEEKIEYHDLGESGGDMLVPSPDIDGTYGDNNPGIRMFLASGQAVEFGGYNISYSYSDQPIPALSENCLGK